MVDIDVIDEILVCEILWHIDDDEVEHHDVEHDVMVEVDEVVDEIRLAHDEFEHNDVVDEMDLLIILHDDDEVDIHLMDAIILQIVMDELDEHDMKLQLHELKNVLHDDDEVDEDVVEVQMDIDDEVEESVM